MKTSSTPRPPRLRSARLLEQVREMIRYRHYSLSTEKSYVHWVRLFVRWSGREGPMRHPRDMGQAEVKAFWPCWRMNGGYQPPPTTRP